MKEPALNRGLTDQFIEPCQPGELLPNLSDGLGYGTLEVLGAIFLFETKSCLQPARQRLYRLSQTAASM